MAANKRLVLASYKTGQYIGEAEDERNQMVLIKVMAVVSHPWQGDLHHPKQADVPFFQERRALSNGERTWVPIHTIKDYEGNLPEYKQSLRNALDEYIAKLKEDGSEWAKRSLDCLFQLEKDYKLD
ncbi:kinase-associated lipoprotein B [Fictibacillus phosphorivorans]|uniref:kinase-associated lipoprotein B n=1 Tax=Fictibacillus phosphorivorans TaxID=1221500 RepID=UPI00203CE748|nr:kinase-associated lipoprotein B [Fictibacillus phosphorivorans]MCM3719298.1 kinase-associated lipoprotein B [Fictibacillus phosphorivorans]MCM3776920.1 kinase-associated lipoprotein B [Fictibacillus phosphorivorans]